MVFHFRFSGKNLGLEVKDSNFDSSPSIVLCHFLGILLVNEFDVELKLEIRSRIATLMPRKSSRRKKFTF